MDLFFLRLLVELNQHERLIMSDIINLETLENATQNTIVICTVLSLRPSTENSIVLRILRNYETGEFGDVMPPDLNPQNCKGKGSANNEVEEIQRHTLFVSLNTEHNSIY